MLRGRLGDRVWYISRGKQRVRALGVMDRQRWQSDPAFAGSRRASGVFGASAALSGVFRDGLGPGCHFLGGLDLHRAMTSAIQQTYHSHKENRGPARLTVRDWVPVVLGLPFFRPGLPFVMEMETSAHCTLRVRWDKKRGGIPNQEMSEVGLVGGFYRFSVLGIWLSDGVIGEQGFRAAVPVLHGKTLRLVSDFVAAEDMDGFVWDVNLVDSVGGTVPAGAGFAYCVGVEYVASIDQVEADSQDFATLLAQAEAEAGILHLAPDSQTRRKFRARFRKDLGNTFVGIVAGGLLIGQDPCVVIPDLMVAVCNIWSVDWVLLDTQALIRTPVVPAISDSS